MFGATNPIRKYVIYLTTNQYFEVFVILTILVNCVILALNDAPEEAEYIFTAIYSFEMIMKIISRGFILDKLTYLRDPWNWLDFGVVTLGYATLVPGMMVNFSGIRTFRVLRALRTISAIEGLKTMVNALLRSMRMLSDVLILTAFFICVFALIGLQLFSGKLRSRCVTSNLTIPVNSSWIAEAQKSVNWYGDIAVCGNNTGSMMCPSNYTCLEQVAPNPNFGYTSYDNFGWSLLTSFQLLTLDFWEDVYFHVLSSLGPWYTIYFIFVIFIGAFLIFNLMLAVVAVSYQQEAFRAADKGDQYQYLLKVGFVYTTNRCSMPQIIYEGPVLDMINTFQESKKGVSLIVIYTGPAEKSFKKKIAVGKMLHVENYENENEEIKERRDIKQKKKTIGRFTELLSGVKSNKNRVADVSSSPENNNSKTLVVDTLDEPNNDKNAVVKNGGSPARSNGVVQATPHTPENNVKNGGPKIRNSKYEDGGGEEATKSPFPYQIRAMVYVLVTSPRFEALIVLFIIFNTICLALEYHGMSKDYKRGLNNANHTFTIIFILEFALKLIALGLRGYLKSRWNIFDGVVVSISIVDLIIEMSTSTENGDFTIIRSLRLFRVLKIANSWTTMRSLISAMGRSLNALANLTIILAIVLYMFAVVGTQLFAKEYIPSKFPSKQVPDWNFTNFPHSFLVIFRILCGEWIELLYECMLVTGLGTPFFFIAALIIGNFLILNLFLALLLGSFAEQSLEEEAKNRANWQSKLKWTRLSNKLNRITLAFKAKKKVAPLDDLTSVVTEKEPDEKNGHANGTANGGTKNGNVAAKRLVRFADDQNKQNDSSIDSISSASSTGHFAGRKDSRLTRVRSAVASSSQKMKENWTKLRAQCEKIKDSKSFDYFIIFIIMASSIILVFEDIHLPTKPKLQKALEILNFIFCILFVIELILKVTAMGFIKYIKNGWNVLDLLIVMASIVSVFKLSNNFKTVRSIRTLRSLRPLQAVSRWNGIKIIVNSLIRAIPSIANVVLVCLMFWLIFSILGVQFFGGKFFKCVDTDGERSDPLVIPNKNACLHRNLTWKNSHVNFDNALNGFLALFQVATFEGWIEIMRDAVDATSVDQQPSRQNNQYAYFYFVIFVIIGSFVILNLFISVMIDNFYALKKQQDDYGSLKIFLSPIQKRWLSTVKKTVLKKPTRIMEKPKNRYLGRLFELLCSASFEMVVMVLIFLNIIIMMLEHYQQSNEIRDVLHYTNIIFTAIFFMEIVLKMIAFRKYFYIHVWNCFDFFVILLSVIEIILHYYQIDVYMSPSMFRVSRVLRIGRLLRYFNEAKGIRRLLLVLVNSSSSVFHMAILLFLLLFIYSVVGMTNFGHVKKTGALNDIVNFETFGSSMLLLLRCSTSAGWNEVLDSLMIRPPDCDKSNCPAIWSAVVYFVTYILFSFLVVVNMHIAIILENFNEAYQESENGITDEDLDMYYAVWQLYDPNATQFIPFEKVFYIVANLGPPLGLTLPNRISVHNLNLPINMEEKVHCNDLLQGLVQHFFTQKEDEDIVCPEMKTIIDKKSHSAYPILQKNKIKTTSMKRLNEEQCAVVIQRAYRKFTKKRQYPQADDNNSRISETRTLYEVSSLNVRSHKFDSIIDLNEYTNTDNNNDNNNNNNNNNNDTYNHNDNNRLLLQTMSSPPQTPKDSSPKTERTSTTSFSSSPKVLYHPKPTNNRVNEKMEILSPEPDRVSPTTSSRKSESFTSLSKHVSTSPPPPSTTTMTTTITSTSDENMSSTSCRHLNDPNFPSYKELQPSKLEVWGQVDESNS